MVKFYFSLLFLAFSFCMVSQSYPYLNASAGNENEFPVDKDTNIYMFHGNRLVKTDKNFNTVWANTYSGITFSSLLLSKTGSIYFISGSGSFGKINANGSLNWIRSTSVNAMASLTTSVSYSITPKRLLLDRNNNLVLTGSQGSMTNATGFIIKTDTNGNGLMFKVFGSSPSYFHDFSVMSDSGGVYKLLGLGMPTIGPAVNTVLFRYNDNLNTMLLPKSVFNTAVYSGFGHRYIRSKFNNNYYIQISSQTPTTSYNMAGIAKLNMNGQVLWNKEFSKMDGSLYAFSLHLEEDAEGKLLYSIDNITGAYSYTSGLVALDSNGAVLPSTPVKMINGAGFLTSMPSSRARTIHSNKYYFDILGSYFLSNPLTVQGFDSSFFMPCSSSTTFSVSTPPNSFFTVGSIFTAPITSFTLTSLSSAVTPTTFTASSNLCTVLKVEETVIQNELRLYPNPVNATFDIDAGEYFIEEIEIYDLSGKKVKTINGKTTVDITDFSEGIYFVRLKTDKGQFSRKFIKN